MASIYQGNRPGMARHWDDYSDQEQTVQMINIEDYIKENAESLKPLTRPRPIALALVDKLREYWPDNPYSVEDIEKVVEGESFVGKTITARQQLQDRAREVRAQQVERVKAAREALDNLWKPEQSSDSLPYSLDELLRTSMALVQHGGQLHYEHSMTISGMEVRVTAHTPLDPMPPASGGALILTVTTTPLPQRATLPISGNTTE